VPALIPAAIDQDPYWRVTRDVAQKLGYYKPAQIHCRFLPGLGAGGKMSASMPETSIFTTDQPDDVKKKIWGAFTGGKPTAAEQRKTGANPTICSIFQYYYYLFEYDTTKLKEREYKCITGEMLCGECKKDIAEKLNKFLQTHQENREKAKNTIEQYHIKR
jgi:tryptophanyl-tRNA synthetase